MADAEMGVEKLYAIFGVFDLDPAAATPPNVRAAVHYKLADQRAHCVPQGQSGRGGGSTLGLGAGALVEAAFFGASIAAMVRWPNSYPTQPVPSMMMIVAAIT